MNQKKYKRLIVLCSSGLDSFYNLLEAKKQAEDVIALFIDYCQKASTQEYSHVQELCKKTNTKHIKADLNFFKDLDSTLLEKDKEISTFKSLNEIDNNDLPKEWVPNRNGVFVNVAGAFAESLNADAIVIGINKEEAGRYPDNTQEFINRTNNLFEYSTLKKTKLISFSVDKIKTEILKELTILMKEYNLNYNNIWSCYSSLEKMCGSCESCLRLKNALKESDIEESLWLKIFLM
jgi:7-cyano-7-deazaguanine synthase